MFLIKFCVSFAAICAVQSARCNNMMTLINDNFVNERDKEIILTAHNDVRDLVNQGRIGPMPRRPLDPLMWDDNLARLAKEAALTCETDIVDQDTAHDCIGQNNWYRKTYVYNNTINWRLPMNDWISKSDSFIYPDRSKDGEKIGLYTQMVWSDTTDVGCAAVQYQDKYSDDDRYVYLAVCNYQECGNIPNEAPYEID